MKLQKLTFLSVLSIFMLTSCAGNPYRDSSPYGGEKAQVGAVTGAATGAVIGALTSSKKDRGKGALIGAAAGGVIGGTGGYVLDKKDREREQYYQERRRYEQERYYDNNYNRY